MRRRTSRGMVAGVFAVALVGGLVGWTSGTAGASDQRADGVIFSDDFESGNLDQWEYQACPDGVTESTDVARSGTHAAKFTVSDDDTNANCDKVPTHNPRAQIVSDGLFHDGDEYYIGFSVLFPADFPTPPDWFQLAELYGEPFGGSPTMGVDLCGDRICFERDESHGYDHPWQSPSITRGQWQDIVLHVKFSTDQGFVEIWHNGVQQTMSNGSTRVTYRTLNPDVNWDGTPNSVFLNQYRAQSSMGTVTLYEDDLKVATSYDAAKP